MSLATRRVMMAADKFILGETKPSARNTGYLPSTQMTDVTSVYTASTAGEVITNRRFKNYVVVTAPNVTFRNCEFLGPSTTGFVNPMYGLVNCRAATATNVLIDRCTIHPQAVKTAGFWWLVGVSIRSGATVTVRRCNLYHTVDGVNVGGGNGSVATVEGCYIHDLSFMNNCNDQATSSPPYWTHNDAVQILGDSGHQIVGNNISCAIAPLNQAGYDDGIHGIPNYAAGQWGSGITVSPSSPVTNVIIRKNWLDYGDSNFQMSYVTPSNMNLGYIGENRFGRGQYDYGGGSRYQIRYKSGAVIAGLTTNYFDPESPTVPVNKKGNFFSVGFDTGIRLD